MLSIIAKLLTFLDKRSKIQLCLLLFPMLIIAVLEMLSIGIIVPFIQVVISGGDSKVLSWAPEQIFRLQVKNALMLVGGAFAALFIVKNILILGMIYVTTRFTQLKLAIFLHRMFGLYLHRNYTFYLERNSSEIVRNLSSSAGSAFEGLRLGLNVILDCLLAAAALVILMIVEPEITLAMGAGLLIAAVGLFKVLGPLLHNWGERAFKYEAKVIQSVHQGLGAIKDIKVLNCQPAIIQTYKDQTNALAKYATLSLTANQSPRLFIETAMVLGFLVVIFSLTETHDSINDIISTVGIFGMAALRLMPSMNRILSGATEIRHRTALVETLYQDLKDGKKEVETLGAEGEIKPLQFETEIRLNDVVFNYPSSEEPALKEISFAIKKGLSVGLVGESGSGKTTTADIILGLLRPRSGTLLVDGEDAFSNIAGWQRHLGYVPQSIYILDDTLRRNIAFGVSDEEIDDEAVAQSLKMAQLERVLKDLPDGLETLLGERGTRLSGGQRQRVGIARALYRNPSVVIFDEATSSLDSKTELEVSRAIDGLSGTKTLIVIAHRLSTVRQCDQIVFMKHGQVRSVGTFDDLQREDADFKRLVSLGKIGSAAEIT